MSEGSGVFEVARKQIYWMIAGIVIIIVVFAFAMIISSYMGALTGIPAGFKAELISLRFLNTPECFTYQDPVTGRVFPGVIDFEKFTSARLDQCYRTESKTGYNELNFALQLEGYETLKDGSPQLLMTNNYFNQVDFTLYKNVFVRVNNELVPTRMVIYVQEKI